MIPREAVDHLRSSDRVMSELVGTHGPLEYRLEDDLWRSLVGSIVGQQLSLKAAATILGRVGALGSKGFPTPEMILAVPEDELRQCGLSRAKLSYLKDLAKHWFDGEIDPETLRQLGDEEIIEHLTRVRGIGRWTAEMVLIFSLGRPDVLAVDDLGIRNAAQLRYGLAERPDRMQLERLGEPWRPYRSYASLYLWRSLQAQ